MPGFVEEVAESTGCSRRSVSASRRYSLTAVITADAVRALKFRRGDDAVAIVKSTEVMIAKAGTRKGG